MACITSASNRAPDNVLGTFAWAAPELLLGDRCAQLTDVPTDMRPDEVLAKVARSGCCSCAVSEGAPANIVVEVTYVPSYKGWTISSLFGSKGHL